MGRATSVLVLLGALGAAATSAVAQSLPNFEGRPAPRLENGVRVGPGVPRPNELKGNVVLVFFWAHWCSDCKAQSPVLANLAKKYRPQGLVMIAPTRLYGYVASGRPAAPDNELPYIVQVRDKSYPFLRGEPVPVSETNYKRYGVDVVPTLVLIDRAGIIRLYHSGQMTEEALDAAIRRLM